MLFSKKSSTFAPANTETSMNGTNKRYRLTLIVCALGVLLLGSCKGNKAEEQARARVEQARVCIEQGNLEAAKLQLDSVHMLYRQEVAVRREAKVLQDSISLLEAERTAAYADSMLQVLLPQVDPLMKKFRYDKDAKYEDNGQYVSRLLQTTSNTERCFLQAYVGDNRLTRVKSYYFGQGELCQQKVELCAMPAEDCYSWTGSEHHFTASSSDQDGFHSILTIEGDEAIAILTFINTHANERIRVRLNGITAKGKSISPYTYTYYLGQNEKNALVETLQLAILFHDIRQLEEMMDKSRKEIDKLHTRNQQ